MAKNEAKIRFTAETGDFNKSIKSANNEMSYLRAELKRNAEQMKTEGETTELLAERHVLLQSQLDASKEKTEALRKKAEKAAEIFGENSEEATKLRTQLANAEAAEVRLAREVDDAADKLEKQRVASKESADGMAEAKSATERLTDTIEEQQKELDRLRKEHEEVVLQYGKNSREAKALGREIDGLSSELKENKDKLDDAERAADKFDNSLDDAGESADGFNGKLGAVAVGVAAAAAALVEFGETAMDAFNEVDEGADNVIKATGATGEQAAALEESYNKVASQIVGDFGDIGSALGEVNTRFGYTGADAEDATKRFLKFSEVTGMDATSAIQAVSRAIESNGLHSSEYANILDQLTKAGQVTGVSVDTLATSLTDNGAVMRTMGYDTSETIAILAQFEKAGVNGSSVTRGMQTAIKKWSADGKDAKEEFAKMVQGIADGSVTAADAYEVFGAKAGVELVDAIQSGRFSYEDMLSVIQDSKGALETTFDGTVDGGYELDLAMQNCKLALAEVGGVLGTELTPVFQWFSDTAIPALVDGFGSFVDTVKDAVSWMKEHKEIMAVIGTIIGIVTTAIVAYNAVQAIKTAMDAVGATTVWGLVAAHIAQAAAAIAAVAPYILIVAAIAAVIAIIVLCIKYWDKIVEAVKRAWEFVKQVLANVGNWIYQNVIQPVLNFFKNLWTGVKAAAAMAWDMIKGIWSAVKSWFNNTVIQPVKNFFSGLWNSVKTTASNAWAGVKNIWAGITGFFRGIVSKVKTVFAKVKDTILSPFRRAIDAVKGLFGKLKLSFPDIKLPHFGISPPGWKIGDLLKGSIPKLAIDWYKDGGIMTRPTIFGMHGDRFMAGGEAGPEAILPIDRLEGYISGAIERSTNVLNFHYLARAIEDLASRPVSVRIGDREIAVATASASDNVNGLRSTFRSRGLVLD